MDRVLFWNGKIIKRHHVRDPAWDMRVDGRSNNIGGKMYLQVISITMTMKAVQDCFCSFRFYFVLWQNLHKAKSACWSLYSSPFLLT